MASLESLPYEVVEHILCQPGVTTSDLVNFSLTNKRGHSVVADNRPIWSTCFRRSFPAIHKRIKGHQKANGNWWKHEFQECFEAKKFVRMQLKEMTSRSWLNIELSKSDFAAFDDYMLQRSGFTCLYIFHELIDVHNNVYSSEDHDLTTKFFAAKAARHVKSRMLTPKIKNSIEEWKSASIDSYQMYEKAMVLIADWLQLTVIIDEAEIGAQLDAMAEQVYQLMLVKEIITAEAFPSVKALKNAEKSYSLGKQILDTTNLYWSLEGFLGNRARYYDPDNSFINRVLTEKLGIPITLSLLYICLVGRLGIYCQPVNFPRHFIIRWSLTKSERNQDYIYIDAFDGGKQRDYSKLMSDFHNVVSNPDAIYVASIIDVTMRLLHNILNIEISNSQPTMMASASLISTLELLVLMAPESIKSNYAIMLSRMYLQQNINHEEAKNLLQSHCDASSALNEIREVKRLLELCEIQMKELETTPEEHITKTRSSEDPHGSAMYHVGMVALHKRYDYKCVIYGWDNKCDASQTWISQMGVDMLEQRDKQPFYNVLVDDGSRRYAAQENLVPFRPVRITHPDIGRYFKEFVTDKGYVPNEVLSKIYPEDVGF